MDYKELVENLKKMLPSKIPYGELVGAPWPYTGQGEMVYKDPEPYFIEQAITAINNLLARAESAEARAEKAERERDEYKLKELVQADREGRCVVLPCKVGDKLYKISEKGVKEVVAQSIVFMLSHTVTHLTVHVANKRGAMTEVETKDFGKTVFLTREEAEAALEKMKGGNE